MTPERFAVMYREAQRAAELNGMHAFDIYHDLDGAGEEYTLRDRREGRSESEALHTIYAKSFEDAFRIFTLFVGQARAHRSEWRHYCAGLWNGFFLGIAAASLLALGWQIVFG